MKPHQKGVVALGGLLSAAVFGMGIYLPYYSTLSQDARARRQEALTRADHREELRAQPRNARSALLSLEEQQRRRKAERRDVDDE